MAAEQKDAPKNPLRQFFLEKGYVNFTETFDPSLPEETVVAGGAKIIRTGQVTSWVQQPWGRGEKTMVTLGGLFWFDPKRGEVTIKRSDDPEELAAMGKVMANEGYKLVPSAPDRVVGYKPLSSK